MKYEITITGSSRPSLYPILIESFNKMVKMKEKPKITAYEDVIFPSESAKVKKFLKDKVDNYVEINPNIRLGGVFNKLLDNLTCEYFVYLQDDWKILKEIDLDLMVQIMDKNPDIKQIWFPKKLENYTYKTFCKETIQISGVDFVPYLSWTFIPNIARTKFVRNVWKEGEVWKDKRPENKFKRALKAKNLVPKDVAPYKSKDVKSKNIISYILGKKHDEYIQHLGLPSDKGIEYDQRTIKMIERKKKGIKGKV